MSTWSPYPIKKRLITIAYYFLSLSIRVHVLRFFICTIHDIAYQHYVGKCVPARNANNLINKVSNFLSHF